MDLIEEISLYPGIMDKVKQLGKVKGNFMNKKLMAEATELWQRFTPEELDRLDREIEDAPIIMKSAVITPTAVCYYSIGVFFAVPVRDIIWMYPRLIKESMNFIPTGKRHQIFMMERNGDQHLVCQQNTLPFTRKTPANDALEYIQSVLDRVRKGIFYGYSKDLSKWICSNPLAAAAQVDAESAM